MLVFILAYLGGVLTIVSPCILPVLPFVFARSDQPFVRSGLPLLAGMALTFALVATLAAVGGGWAVQANEVGRWAALVLLALFGVALIFPALSDRMTRPLVAWGSRLSNRAGSSGGTGSSLLLGVATGLLWAPCAGPILGIIFTTAALQGASPSTTLLLLAYAAGAATSLAIALLAGGKVFARMKRSLGAGERIKQVLGVFVLLGVGAIAFGLDTRVLAKLSSAQTSTLESALARKLRVQSGADTTEARSGAGGMLVLPVEGQLPPLEGLGPWINSPPLMREQLHGKVVVIDFWTYSCINCLRAIPYVRAWHERYAKDGLVIIGVHAPEFAFEREPENVRKAVRDLGILYPVVLDNDYELWRGFNNRFWPAHYFIDAQGRVRYHHFGEGNYAKSEQVIRQLLAEGGRAPTGSAASIEMKDEAEVAADFGQLKSPETYIGYRRAEHFVSPGGMLRDKARDYTLPKQLELNHWALGGRWTVGLQSARLESPGGRIAYRFHARDLHLVLGPAANGRPVRFRVSIDGKAPGSDAGGDVAPNGNGIVSDERLYQLFRQRGAVRDRLFTIEFLDPGVSAFAFTFG
jgi:cytochrome c biogenesis protein CcdA/thiol-disulfide isomerase/thioredoxin